MAYLREQSRLVRAVYERPFHSGALALDATQEVLVMHFCQNPIFLTDKNANIANLSPKELDQRERKIETLIRACLQDGFIEPVKEQRTEIDMNKISIWEPLGRGEYPMRTYEMDHGYYATSKGSDLLKPIGFFSAIMKKYQLLLGILFGVILTGLYSFIKYVVENADAVKHSIQVFKSVL